MTNSKKSIQILFHSSLFQSGSEIFFCSSMSTIFARHVFKPAVDAKHH